MEDVDGLGANSGRVMRRKLFIVATTVFVTLAAYAVYYPFSSAGVQAREMRRAAEFIPTAKAAVAGDVRFEHVEFHPYSAAPLLVRGFVRTGDLATLKDRVKATSPPVAVSWQEQEFEEPTFSRMVELNRNE